MAGSVNKVIIESYTAGKSLTELSSDCGIPISTIRYAIHKAGVLRGRTEAVRLASDQGRLGSGNRGRARVFTEAHKANIKKARQHWGENNSVGFRITSSGYIEFTRGPNKGRSAHVVLMEVRLGRALLPDEVVHHIDGDPINNSPDNLALMTRSGHARHHRREDRLIKQGGK